MNTHDFHNSPRISVLMPIYNATRYLREAVDSILAQSFEDFELICIDDGSTDGSTDLLADYDDPRLRVIRQHNTGIVGALNHGLRVAGGELIARMDADDTCSPLRFEKQVEYLDTHAECIAVGSWISRMDPYGSPIGELQPPTNHEIIEQELLKGDGSVLVHATLMMRRDALIHAGGWDDRYNWVEDLDLFLRLTEQGKVANIPEYLYAYRRHLDSVCVKHYKTMCERLRQVLIETYRRRGLDLPQDFDNFRTELAPKQSIAMQRRHWACHAIHHGNAPVARKHAIAAICRSPWSIESWRVFAWSMAA